MIEARRISKRYVPSRWGSRRGLPISAVDDVSLTVDEGSTLALVGQSGAGKSTFGRCLCLLEKPDSGAVWFEGRNLLTLQPREWLAVRRSLQFVFQDAAIAINPRFSAIDVVEEPLRIQANLPAKARREKALALMEQVGISSKWGERPALEFSGGERQRLAIARALILKPRLLVLDEALSGLDQLLQAQIAKLLIELRASLSLTYLFITHDLSSAAYLADRIAVMREGKIVEANSVSNLFFRPQHPYTRLLLAAIPGAQTEAATQFRW